MRSHANETLIHTLNEFNHYAEGFTSKSKHMLKILEEMIALNPSLIEETLLKELQEHFLILSEEVDIRFSGYENFSEMFFAVNYGIT